MFSSCPVSALVAGLNSGGSSRSLSSNPAGIASPASVPLALYSFHADPAMYPRITHSIGKTVVRRQSIARPASVLRCIASEGTAATISSISALIMWCQTSSSNRRSHHAVIWVSTAPLCGIGSAMTTSNALTRSVATRSNRNGSTSYTSRTFPRRRWRKGRGASRVIVILAPLRVR
jgi:hypothetical protein